MIVGGKHYRTVWFKPDNEAVVQIIDQRKLPFQFVVEDLTSVESAVTAIADMHVRGAGCIGVTAGYAMYLATLEASKTVDFDSSLKNSAEKLIRSRPTAVNLEWAVKRQLEAIRTAPWTNDKIAIAKKMAQQISDEDADCCRKIGEHGLNIIQDIHKKDPRKTVNILTHCNAGWLAFADYGSATAPIYAAHNLGIPIHVWVDETRPRNQGARLTAWELGQHGVPHTVIADNCGCHLMQHGLVDMVITGADRVTRAGDVANKIGTYLKALAAYDNEIPFYVALPSSTFDWQILDGVKEIPIEQRGGEEVTFMEGVCDGKVKTVRILPDKSPSANYGFDVTPARLITALITERGLCHPSEAGIQKLFPKAAPSETFMSAAR